MRHLDLFSGIGGFALAARWMGWETIGFCEIEDYPRAVLKKNFPGVPIHDDIHTLDARDLRVDLITGGFPCQPHSTAGLRRGRDDSRHLWPQFARIIAEARPAWVVIENVPGIRTTAADEVLADLESLGYACWPLVVGAVHAGAPHRRQRVWIVASASGGRLLQRQEQDLWPETGLAAPRWHDPERLGADAANTIGSHLRDESRRIRCELADGLEPRCAGTPEPGHDGAQGTAADATHDGRSGGSWSGESGRNMVSTEPLSGSWRESGTGESGGCGADAAHAGREPLEVRSAPISTRKGEGNRHSAIGSDVYQPDWRGWTDAPQPVVRAVDDGLPAWVAGCRVPALKALGNAIVPQVAYHIFKAMENAHERND